MPSLANPAAAWIGPSGAIPAALYVDLVPPDQRWIVMALILAVCVVLAATGRPLGRAIAAGRWTAFASGRVVSRHGCRRHARSC